MALGPLIRDLRLTLGMSQSRLAAALCDQAAHATVTRDEVRRWEANKRSPRPFWLRHLAAVLQVPTATLQHRERPDFVNPTVASRVAPVVACDLLERGFAHALGEQPSAEDWQAALHTYGRDYMVLGAAEVQRRVTADLVLIQQQLDTPQMWATAAKLSTLYAKTFPGTDGARAVNWYLLAARAADRSEDRASRVWVRGRAAIALGYEGAALGVADTLARQALDIDDRPSLGRLNALMGRAHAAAIRGEAATAQELLTSARRTFDAVAHHEQEADSDYAVPWWRFNVFISLLGARLGDERTAETAHEEARRNLPADLPRFATHLELHRALMVATSGNPAGGAVYARAALAALPPERHSLTLRMLLGEIESHAPDAEPK